MKPYKMTLKNALRAKKLSKNSTNRAPSKRVVLIDATTNVRSEIYPSKYYVLKHVPVLFLLI